MTARMARNNAPPFFFRPLRCSALPGVYRVARDDLAFRDLLFEFVSPPPTIAGPSRSHVLSGASSSSASAAAAADLMQMGFPALLTTTYPGMCACHGKLKTSGYGCPRCKARLCDVPTECRVCGLTVVNAPQLARSYRHLFPVRGGVFFLLSLSPTLFHFLSLYAFRPSASVFRLA